MPVPHALMNGKRVPADLAQVPLDDYLAADGLAVAVRIRQGQPCQLDDHLRLLAEAIANPMATLGFAVNPLQAARELTELLRLENAGDGVAVFAAVPSQAPAPRPAIALRPLPAATAKATNGAVLAMTSVVFPAGETYAALPWIHAPWPRLAALAGAARHADGGLAMAADGTPLFACYGDGFLLGDAAAAAVFAVVDGALITPDPERNRLPHSVARHAVERAAARQGVVVYHEPLAPAALGRASEIFTADSARGLLPTRQLLASDGNLVAAPSPAHGPMVAAIAQEIAAAISQC
ncbi:MAG: aminotransferase class IV [Planctomycetes bacterium]|nr:aminotransferase class IV [Planctomycetota bacterium]